MVDIWARSSNPRPATEYRVRLAADTFVSLVGNLFVADIRRDTLLDFRDLLHHVPRRQFEAERSLHMSERHAIWSRERLGERARLTTVQSKLQIIRALVRFAYIECWIDSFELRALHLTRPGNSRRSFSKCELFRLFGSQLFTRPWSAPHRRCCISPTTIRWVMLIALMTGARLEEIGQLQVQDVREEGGIWALHISDRDGSGAPTTKKLKDARVERAVPIHRRLVDLGFLRFADKCGADGSVWLFEELKLDRVGHRTHTLSCRLARIVDRVSTDPRLVFHSFRHSFKDIARESGMADSTDRTCAADRRPPLWLRRRSAGLADAVSRLDFEIIDWEPILRAAAASD